MNTLLFQKKLLAMQESLFSFALKLTENREDAQDLFQDTILRALNNQDKFVYNTNFNGWVMLVMRNIFFNNYHKRCRLQKVMNQDADIYNLEVMNGYGIDSPDYSYTLNEITKAIESLSSELYIPFSLYISGYRYLEIAKKLNVPLGTVKSRIFFARLKLQKVLTDFH